MTKSSLRTVALSALVITGVLSLGGCSTAFFTEGFGVVPAASTAEPTPSPSATASPRPTPSPTRVIESWSECERITTDLNRSPSGLVKYQQVEATAFPIKEVGLAKLRESCVLSVTTGGETVYWAVMPGDATLAAQIKASLLDAGFAPSGIADSFGNAATSQGALVSSFANGAALDTFLAGTTAFARISEPLVYVGAYFLS